MNRFFTMLIKQGKDGPEDPKEVFRLIQNRNVVVWDGDYPVLDGLVRGDYLVVRSAGRTLCLLSVASDETEKFRAGGEYGFFSWASLSRRVEVCGWFDNDHDELGVELDSWAGCMQTCQCVKSESQIAKLENWLLRIKERKMLNDVVTFLSGAKNVILTGAPGTGKTYLAREIAMKIAKSEARVTNVQFHPSYGYADFVEGLRPVKKGDVLGFERRDGAFMKLCRRAVRDKEHNYVVVIDEINRGDIAKIFGELFSLIEKDYRTFDGKVDGKKVAVETQYGNLWMDGFEDDIEESAKGLFKDGFFVPQNVYIIGTMNDVDRSVESMDFAIRRRFVWLEVEPNDRLDAMCAGKGIDEAKRGDIRLHMAALNDRIKKDPALGPAYQIGPSYFIRLGDGGYEELWNEHLSHLFKEYLRGNPEQEKIVDGYHQLLLNPVAKDDNDAQGSDN